MVAWGTEGGRQKRGRRETLVILGDATKGHQNDGTRPDRAEVVAKCVGEDLRRPPNSREKAICDGTEGLKVSAKTLGRWEQDEAC